MKLTAHLKNLLDQQQSRLTDSEFINLESEVHRLVKVYIDLLLQFQSGPGRAGQIHQLLDEQNKAQEHVQISCQKGCGACCHLEVEITEDEAKLLARFVQNGNLSIDRSHIEIQARRSRQDEAWRTRVAPENRCVFLDEANSCRVYEVRPIICRKHAVVSLPSDCLAENGEPVSRIVPLNEIIVSAVVNLPETRFASLSKMLLQALDREKEVDRVHQLEILEDEPALEKPRLEPETSPPDEAMVEA